MDQNTFLLRQKLAGLYPDLASQDAMMDPATGAPILPPGAAGSSARMPAGVKRAPMPQAPPSTQPLPGQIGSAAAVSAMAPGMNPNEAHSTVKTNDQSIDESREQQVLPTEQFIRLRNMLQGYPLPGFQEATDSRDGLKALLQAKLQQKPQLDLSPMMGLVQAWSKDKDAGAAVAKAYNKPATSDEDVALNYKMADGIQKADDSIAKNNWELGKAMTGSQITQKVISGQATDNGVDHKYLIGVRGMNDAVKARTLNSHVASQLKPLDHDLLEGTNTLAQLAEGNPIADMGGMEGTVKRMIGGRLSNYDVQKLGQGDPAYVESLKQRINTALRGTLSNHNRAIFRDAITAGNELTNMERENRISQARDFGGVLGMAPDMVDGVIRGYSRTNTGESVAHPRPRPAKPAPAPAPNWKDEFNQWKAQKGK